MNAKDFSIEYLSSGANRQTAVADWSQGGVLAYGTDTNIALWRPESTPSKGISRLLNGHKEQVKAVAFLPQLETDEASYLISGADDKSLIVWKSASKTDDYELLQASTEHTAPINYITALRVQSLPPKWIIASGSADATIKIWSFEHDQLRLLQSLQTTPRFFPLTLSLTHLDGDADVLILAAAGTNDTIQILTAESKAEKLQFTVQATLRGHEGWIRSLSFVKETKDSGSDLLLASASQDKYIRIWRFHQGQDLPSPAAAESDPSRLSFLPGKSPSNKAHWLRSAGKVFSVTFEALLLGHEDWIYSTRWHMHVDGKLQLLSASADNSLAIWEADAGSGIWVSMARLGEISREKGATTATGSTGGFWTGLWSPDGTSVACLGRTGSWRRWSYSASEDTWRQCVAVSGHTKAVTGISWSKNGQYLLSTSSDQTTRLHTQWKTSSEADTWHEMSRPQIHGYDLNCIDSLGATQFVSGADEKLMRVFSEPRAVAMLLSQLSGIGSTNVEDMPEAADMPVLGLSNKAIDTSDDDPENVSVGDHDTDADPAPVVKKLHFGMDSPPFEDTLSRHTLWPETEKLYGHGYEISALAASHDGKLIASACKASSTNHAVIRLFETESWTEVRPPLTAHSLTVTRLRFSADDRYLLSVGRDRQWAVFERTEEGDAPFRPLQTNSKGHSRMILDGAWAPLSERPMFATAGRDKQTRIWCATATDDEKLQFGQVAALPCAAPVTAVDFLPDCVDGRDILALGTEAGQLKLYSISADGSDVVELLPPPELSLPKSILQLAWRPRRNGEDFVTDELAVAGQDGSLRIYAFRETFFRRDLSS